MIYTRLFRVYTTKENCDVLPSNVGKTNFFCALFKSLIEKEFF